MPRQGGIARLLLGSLFTTPIAILFLSILYFANKQVSGEQEHAGSSIFFYGLHLLPLFSQLNTKYIISVSKVSLLCQQPNNWQQQPQNPIIENKGCLLKLPEAIIAMHPIDKRLLTLKCLLGNSNLILVPNNKCDSVSEHISLCSHISKITILSPLFLSK